MKIRKGFQSSSLISQFCSIFGLTHPVVVLDITWAPAGGGLYVEGRPCCVQARRKMRRDRRSASRIAASGVA